MYTNFGGIKKKKNTTRRANMQITADNVVFKSTSKHQFVKL